MNTVGTTTQDHLKLLKWATALGSERLWAIEDCRHTTRRLERDLIAAGESVVRFSPKLMADVCDSARTYDKSDPSDGPRWPGPHCANLICPWPDSMESNVKCVCWSTHREDLVAERTRITSRLR